jgi:hypothetical protein
MTADRFGPTFAGEYTALRSMRPAVGEDASGPDAVPVAGPLTAGGARPEPGLAGPAVSGVARQPRPRQPRPREPRRWQPVLPPQHGAWAFLAVPVLAGFAVAGASAAGWLLLATWLCAYPVGYYGGRALTARVRRGSWTRRARRELGRAAPWAVLTAVLGIPLAWTRPWLMAVAPLLALLWGAGLAVAARLGERSMANDLLLVAQAVAAVPLTVAVVAGPGALTGELAASTALTSALIAAYLMGSVLHVKSLLREAGNRRFRGFSLMWHVGCAVLAAAVSPWWLLGFLPALARAVMLRPGLRPGVIGAVEALVSVLMVIAAFFALQQG